MTNDRFEGKAVLVTGGGSGIGRAAAQRMASEGAQVRIGDVDETGLATTAADHPTISTARCDVSDEESVKRFLAGRDDRNAFVYFLHPQEGADWYVVVTGSFATRELAAGLADARSDLPGHPFPKRMGAYQEQAPATTEAAGPRVP